MPPPQGGAFFGFAVIIAAALAAWAIIALVNVADDDGDSKDYSTPKEANNDIQAALNDASPGDTIYIPQGTHYISLTTAVDGTEDQPITIRRAPGTERDEVILKGEDDESRVLEILHSYYIIEGFTIDGEIEEGEDYREQLIFVEGARDPFDVGGIESSITGVVIQNMVLRHAGKECVRFRYFVTNSMVRLCDIRYCGVEDFQLGSNGENGEGVYIGTATNQWDDKNGKDGPDVCQGNVVTDNYIDTQGSEGAEVKEGSIRNVIQYNQVFGQLAEESGGIGLRGSYNIARYNVVVEARGACIRLGGNQVDGEQYGEHNEVYGNEFMACEYAAVKVQDSPQIICENDVDDPNNPDDEYLRVRGDEASEFDDISGSCPSGLTVVVIPSVPEPSDDDDYELYVAGDDGEDDDRYIPVGSDDDDDDDDDDQDDDETAVEAGGGSGGYEYLGCYSDSGTGRVLNTMVYDDEGNSVDRCVLACAAYGETYAGLQAGSQCWCGSPSSYDIYGTGTCNFDCTGAPSITCGGDYAFSLYIIYGDGGTGDTGDQGDDDGGIGGDESGETALGDDDFDDQDDGRGGGGVIVESDDGDDAWVAETDDGGGGQEPSGDYLGCYRDSDSSPIMDFAYEDEDDLTPASCIASCKEEGDSLAGLQMGAQCFCGSSDKFDRYGKTTCNLPCTGDSSQTCGARAASSVWRVD